MRRHRPRGRAGLVSALLLTAAWISGIGIVSPAAAAATIASRTTTAVHQPTGAEPTIGRQHLVRPGQDLERVLEDVAAGDEVILWPGAYNGATIRGLIGRADAPITIRGLRPDDPPVLEGGAWGLRLLGCSHVRVSDLIIRRPRIDGVEVGPADDGTPSRSIRLERLRVEEVGERPGRHGFVLVQAEAVVMRQVSVHGWTGSGIEIVASRDVIVDGATLEGTGRGELLGIRLRAGTSRASVLRSRIVEPGRGGIAVGGRSRENEFPADAIADASGLRWEVVAPVLEDVTIIGGDVALTFLGATQASLTHLTVMDPRRSAFRIAMPRDDGSFGTIDATALARCLFVWREASDPTLVEFGPGADDEGLWLEENLWWRAGLRFPDEQDFPGQERFPQLLTADPSVDDQGVPRSAQANGFGSRLRPAPSAEDAPPVDVRADAPAADRP